MGIRRHLQHLIHYAEHHHMVPEVVDEQRYQGVILTLVAWLLIAFYTVMFQATTSVLDNQASLGPEFTKFFILELTAMIMLFPFCLARGWRYFKCKRPAMIFVRGLFAAIGICAYSFARAWTPIVDNSILYSTDAIWIVLFLWILGIKISKLAVLGLAVGTVGMLVVWWFDIPSWRDAIGGLWGLAAGVTLAIITLLAPYMIKQDPPLRIAFYQVVIGTAFFAVVCSSYGWYLPSGHELITMITAGIMFASAVICFLLAFFYTESYVIGIISLLLPVFLEALSWVFFRHHVRFSTIAGGGVVTLGCLLVIGDSLRKTKSHPLRYADSGIRTEATNNQKDKR